MSFRKIIACMVGFIIAITSALASYILFIRPWHLRWGSRDEELDLAHPGDDLVPEPKLQATHAVTIQAPPSLVWPWLIQIGQGRGGFYSYDWIENMMGLDIQNTDRILPEYQNLQVGDLIPLAQEGFSIPVAIIDTEKALVLHGDTRLDESGEAPVMKPGDFMAVTWGFYLFAEPGETTRLVERFRADWNDAPYNTIFYRAFLEPGAFVMERKMLLGIKERVEANLHAKPELLKSTG